MGAVKLEEAVSIAKWPICVALAVLTFAATAQEECDDCGSIILKILPVFIQQTSPIQLVSQSIAEGAQLEQFPQLVTVTFNGPVAAPSLSDANVFVEASGGDDTFGDGNESVLTPTSLQVSSVDPATVELAYDPTGFTEDTYRLYIVGDGTTPLQGDNGIAFDGDSDGDAGGDREVQFSFAPPPPPPPSATLSEIQEDIFDGNCAVGGCHDATTQRAGLNLSAGTSFTSLVNTESSFGDGILVVPDNADESVLILRLEGTLTPRMPFGGPFLDQTEVDRVRSWIDDGAQDN